jgi:hypothetical protein
MTDTTTAASSENAVGVKGEVLPAPGADGAKLRVCATSR